MERGSWEGGWLGHEGQAGVWEKVSSAGRPTSGQHHSPPSPKPQPHTHTPAPLCLQANNAYIFPAVGHAAVLVNATAIPDDCFVIAAEELASMSQVEVRGAEGGRVWVRGAEGGRVWVRG